MKRRAQLSFLVAGLLSIGGLGGYLAAPWLHGQSPPSKSAPLAAPAAPAAAAPAGAAPAPAAPREPYSFRDVAKKVLPAVVSIETRSSLSKQPTLRRRPEFPGIPEDFRRFFQDFEDQLERPEPRPKGFGSGFLVDPKGVVLTNYHVVAGAEEVEVQLIDGRKFISRDIKSDPKSDLAIVRIQPAGNLPFLELGDSDAMEIGDRVLAAGAPFGLRGSVSAGIVSAKGRNLNLNMYEDFLQTDAAINPGNSGGPLVNLEGKVIGISTIIKTQSGGFQGVGLAISSNLARNVMTQLLQNGTVRRGYLGIQIKDLTDAELADRLGVKGPGVLVTQVFDKAPAAKAGIQPGDVIVALAGKPLKESKDLQRMVAALPIGKPVDLRIIRDGKEKSVAVTIEDQPDDFGSSRVPAQPAPQREASAVKLPRIGAEVADLTPELAEQLGYRGSVRGVVIVNVEPGGLAATAGLRRGMLITKLERQPTTSAAALAQSLDRLSLQNGILFQVESPQGGTAFVLLKENTGR